MLITALIVAVIAILNALTAFLPSVTTLPYGMDGYLIEAIGYWNSFIGIFPPFQDVFNAFCVYLGFRVTLMLLRLIFGHRAPASST